MCSSMFGLGIMENYDQGDLIDIVRPYGGNSSSSSSQSKPPFSENPMNFSSAMEEPTICNFGDPFLTMQDPLLHHDELNNIPCSSSYFNGRNNSGEVLINYSSGAGFCSSNSSIVLSQKILEDDMLMRRRNMPCNNSIFSSMTQISPNAKHLPPSDSAAVAAGTAAWPGGVCKSPDMVSSSKINANSSKDCLVDKTVQISSRQNQGIKRRKSQVKKVISIPAPAVGNSSGGEIVPCDLWAWRKYGQKPIKGSPYPRGYYRCSSSRGCSARKHVERSRTDPNMLVITYTSEHNHPWPTQRNALAGSARNSHTSKNNPSSSSSKNLSSEKNSQKPKEEEEQTAVVAANNFVKEEADDSQKQQKNLENIDEDEFSGGLSHKPYIMGSTQNEDLFADLGEMEAVAIKLVFSGHGFSAGNNVGGDSSKASYPFQSLH